MMRSFLIVLLALMPLQALADPVSLIVGAIGLTGAVATIATIAGNLLLGAALSSQAKKKARRARARQIADYNANLQDRTANIISATAPQKKIYGEPAPSNVNIVDSFHSGDRDEFIHLVCVWANNSAQSIKEVFIDGKPVGALDSAGWCVGGDFYESRADQTTTVQIAFNGSGQAAKPSNLTSLVAAIRWFGESDEYEEYVAVTVSGANLIGPANKSISVTYTYSAGEPRVNIQKHLGNGVDIADEFLMSRRPDLWTVNHKCTGNAYIILTLSLDFPRFQSGAGEITIAGEGKNDIYNFVTATHGYTANPIRCAADHLRSREGGGLQLTQFDGSWAAAQQIADEVAYPAPPSLPLLIYQAWRLRTGGFAERFRCDGIITADMQRENVIEAFESCFSGQISESAGAWRITPGVWVSPTFSISDSDRLGPLEQVRGGSEGAELFNTSRVNYVPRNAPGGKPVPAPVHSNAALLAEDGGRERAVPVDTTLIADAQRLRQCQRIKIEKSRGGQVVRYSGGLRLWQVQAGDRLLLSDADWSIVSKPYQVLDKGFSLDGPVVLELLEDSALYYDQADNAAGLDPANNALPDALATPPAPINLAADSGDELLRTLSDGKAVSTVRVSWLLPDGGYISDGGSTEVEYKSATDTSPSWSAISPVSGSSASADISPAPDGTIILIRARHRSFRGIPGFWKTISHLVLGKSTPPPNVSGQQVVTEADGNYLYWQPPTVADYAFTWARLGASFDAAAEMGAGGTALKIKGNKHPLGWLVAGPFTCSLKNFDDSGNPSAASVSASITIAPPAAPIYTATVVIENSLRLAWQNCATSQPIKRHIIKVGSTAGSFATASDFSSPGGDERERVLTFDTSDAKRVYHQVEDVAGNLSAVVFNDFLISLPSNLDLVASGSDPFTGGSKTNCHLLSMPGQANALYMLTKSETNAQHFAAYAPRTSAAKAAAGHARHSAPGISPAVYEVSFDAGKLLSASTVTFVAQLEWLIGSGVVTPQIIHKATIGASWTVVNGWAALASNFRYYGLRLTVTTANAGKLLMRSLSYQLSTTTITEPSTAAFVCNAGDTAGTIYTCVKPIVDITAVSTSVGMDGAWVTAVPNDTAYPCTVAFKVWKNISGIVVQQTAPITFVITGIAT